MNTARAVLTVALIVRDSTFAKKKKKRKYSDVCVCPGDYLGFTRAGINRKREELGNKQLHETR